MGRPKIDKTKTCKGCGKVFEAKRSTYTSCSKECSSKIISDMRTAEHKGKEPELLRLRSEGYTAVQICAILDVSKGWIHTTYKELGVPLNDDIAKNNILMGKVCRARQVIDGKKECGHCHSMLPTDQFSFNRRTHTQLSNWCRGCQADKYRTKADKIRQRVRARANFNPDKIKTENSRQYTKNKHRFIEKAKIWSANNPEARKAISRRYNKANQPINNARTAKYRAKKVKATPSWLTRDHLDQIAQLYKTCPKGYHVDHIVPIKGRNVSGLHVPWNLRIIPAIENMRKGNRLVKG
jgi:hypothetical protein